MLEHAYDIGENIIEITLDVTYAESDNSIKIKFSCAGKSYDPLDKDFDDLDFDNLSATILHNLAQNYSHEYSDGVNKINFVMA